MGCVYELKNPKQYEAIAQGKRGFNGSIKQDNNTQGK